MKIENETSGGQQGSNLKEDESAPLQHHTRIWMRGLADMQSMNCDKGGVHGTYPPQRRALPTVEHHKSFKSSLLATNFEEREPNPRAEGLESRDLMLPELAS